LGEAHGLRLDATLELFMESLNRIVVRADFHWLSGNRVKVNSRSPASSNLWATRHFSRHLRRKARRLTSISFAVFA